MPTEHVGWNYIVLALAFAVDFYSWRISYQELRARKDPDESMWDEIIGSKDPTIFTVFLEDTVGLIGAFLAFLGIFLGRLFDNPYLDPIASILVGLLLAAVAILLGRESGALLVGERTNRSRIRRIRQIVQNDPSVEAVGDLLTMQLEVSIDRLENRIRDAEPTIQRIFIEADSLRQTAAVPQHAA